MPEQRSVAPEATDGAGDQDLIANLRSGLELSRSSASPLDQSVYDLYLGGTIKLPPIPQVATNLVNILKRPDVQMDEVVKLLEMDVALASSMLKMANSAGFMASAEIENVQGAVMRIGLRQTACLALSIATRSLYDEDVKRAMKFVDADKDRDWQQAVVVAHSARAVSERMGIGDSDLAYAAALFHGVGRALAIFVLATLASRENEVADLSFHERITTVRRVRPVLTGEYLLREGLPVNLTRVCLGVDSEENDNETAQLISVVLGLVATLLGDDNDQAVFVDRAFSAAKRLNIDRAKLAGVKDTILASREEIAKLY